MGAKAEFMQEFQRALDGLLYELAPAPVKAEYLEDTADVKSAKTEFFRVFSDALNGVIATAYLDDTPEVKEAKEELFKTFESAMNNLLTTVETSYLEDTPEGRKQRQDLTRPILMLKKEELVPNILKTHQR